MPADISRRVVENSYHDIMAKYPFMSLPDLVGLLDAQYAVSTTDAADDPARWAVINAVVALAVRFKTAAGSEDDISPIAQSFYNNAAMVYPQLIHPTPSMLSIQALLAMAVFARGIPDAQTLILLVNQASCQLEVLDSSKTPWNSMSHVNEHHQYEQIQRVVKTLTQEVRLML
jgi:hypothetical protein